MLVPICLGILFEVHNNPLLIFSADMQAGFELRHCHNCQSDYTRSLNLKINQNLVNYILLFFHLESFTCSSCQYNCKSQLHYIQVNIIQCKKKVHSKDLVIFHIYSRMWLLFGMFDSLPRNIFFIDINYLYLY